MIKTIIFDYGGVLGPDATDWASMYQQLSKVTHLPNETINALWSIHKEKLLKGKEDMPDFFDKLAKKSKEKITEKKLLDIYLNATYADEKALDFARHLKKKGYKLLILSLETKTGMKNKIKKFHLKSIFEEVYCSADLGMTKRDPKFFHYVLKKEKIKPEETIFIDDYQPNIDRAISLGIQAIHFTSLEELKKRMENFGI